jgi:hypothetical protein
VVSVLATGPTRYSVVGSSPAHFLRSKLKPSVPCRRFTACKRTLQNMSEMLRFSPVILLLIPDACLLNRADSKKWLATCSSNTLNQAMEPY